MTEFASAIQYSIIAATNDAYRGDVWCETQDLQSGGYRMRERASHHLPRLAGETVGRYRSRLNATSQINYFGRTVGYFVANLFARDLVVAPPSDADDASTMGSKPIDDGFWQLFSQDADRRKTKFSHLIKAAIATALTKGKAIIACDFPAKAADANPVNLADEDASGTTRGYCFEVAPDDLLDWEIDEEGRFEQAILRSVISKRESPTKTRGAIVEEQKIWQRVEGPNGPEVYWAKYQTKPRKKGEKIAPTDEVVLVDSDKTSFRSIPLVVFELPEDLWLGNQIGPIVKEHFQRRSALVAAQNAALVTAPVVTLGPEVGAVAGEMTAEKGSDPNRGDDPVGKWARDGQMVLGERDKISFPEQTGAAQTIVDAQLVQLVDEIFRVVYQMAASVSSTANAVGRSGESKAEDRSATEIVLGAQGELVRDFARRIYEVISTARDENVVWTPHGLDEFTVGDRTEIIAEAQAGLAATIPSKTYRRRYLTQLARAILGAIEPATWATIQKEIEDSVDAGLDLPAVEGAEELDPNAAPTTVTLAPTDVASILKVNEGRHSQGFGPLLTKDGAPDPDGEITITEFKAKRAQIVATAAAAELGNTAPSDPPDPNAPPPAPFGSKPKDAPGKDGTKPPTPPMRAGGPKPPTAPTKALKGPQPRAAQRA